MLIIAVAIGRLTRKSDDTLIVPTSNPPQKKPYLNNRRPKCCGVPTAVFGGGLRTDEAVFFVFPRHIRIFTAGGEDDVEETYKMSCTNSVNRITVSGLTNTSAETREISSKKSKFTTF